jgi:twitching motility protein PilT
VSQRLLPRVGGGRIAVHDILRNGARTKESIQMGEAEGKTFYEIQEQGRATYHMQTYDQAISQAYVDGQVTEETAVAYATRKAIVMRAIDRIKQERGEKTTDIENIGLDRDYNRQLKRQ